MEVSSIGLLCKEDLVNANFMVSAQPKMTPLPEKSEEKRTSPGGLSEPGGKMPAEGLISAYFAPSKQ